ncbi:GGDEF domain-containing protein [Marinomonas sp. S3726]|uniref:GGDEF domain-containing protein n=1 Tax=Marinomonas sp. S3726 TaxID=579484 RepID=UPI000697ABCB|nr:GGDEF domain-containing protein [Marinomonas sp. S3726]
MKDFDFEFKDIVETAKDVVIVTKAEPINEPGPEIIYVNQAFTELTGYSKEEVIGKTPRILQSKGTSEKAKSLIRKGLEDKVAVRVTIKNYSKAGKAYWLDLSITPLFNDQGEVTHIVSIQRDVTEYIDVQNKLKLLSRTDPLTGLMNRRMFDEMAEKEFLRYKNENIHYSLLALDIDHFKLINDKYGHPIGDYVLTSFSSFCETHIRSQDKVARIGGEEFCIILPATNKAGAIEVAEKLRREISNARFSQNDHDIAITVSIGVSEVKESDYDYVAMLKRADENLYRAKRKGRNQVYSLDS